MEENHDTLERFKEITHRHAGTIKLIAANFYVPDSYSFHSLVTDLTTHLWLSVRKQDPGVTIRHEQAWVYTILYRKALNIVRNEQSYQKHLVYGADLASFPDNSDSDPATGRLYQLINLLSEEEQEQITMYLDGIPVKSIAAIKGQSILQTHQHLLYLRKKLRKLNEQIQQE